MSFNKIATIVQVSDSEDYSPNYGGLPTPAWEDAKAFLGRTEVATTATSNSSPTSLGLPAAATRVLFHNKDTALNATVGVSGSPNKDVLLLGPGETAQFQVPAGVSAANYYVWASNVSGLTLLAMAWQ